MKFQYSIDPNVSEPIMLINKHIGFDETEGEGINGAEFERELLQFDNLGKKRVIIYINSPGGSVIDGMSIYNAIRNSMVPVDTYCVGLAASIAGVIFQAGRNRVMSNYGKIMLHDPSGGSKKSLAAFKDSIIQMIKNGCGLSTDEISGLMTRESWIKSEEAMTLNLCSEVDESGLKNFSETPEMLFIEANKIINKLLLNKAIKRMEEFKKINNLLGLNPEASTDATELEIKRIQDISTHANGKLKEMQDALNGKMTECEELKKKMAEYEDKMKAKDAADKEAEAKNAAEKAENIVNEAIKLGKIKNEAKEAYMKLALIDFEGTKVALDGVNSNLKATNLIQASKATLPTDPFAGPTNAQMEMAKIQNKLNNRNKQ